MCGSTIGSARASCCAPTSLSIPRVRAAVWWDGHGVVLDARSTARAGRTARRAARRASSGPTATYWPAAPSTRSRRARGRLWRTPSGRRGSGRPRTTGARRSHLRLASGRPRADRPPATGGSERGRARGTTIRRDGSPSSPGRRPIPASARRRPVDWPARGPRGHQRPSCAAPRGDGGDPGRRGPAVVAVPGAAGDDGVAARLVDAALDRFGRLDHLVNAVGGAPFVGSALTMGRDDLLGTVAAQHLADHLVDPGGDGPRPGRRWWLDRQHLEWLAGQDHPGHGRLRGGQVGAQRADQDAGQRPGSPGRPRQCRKPGTDPLRGTRARCGRTTTGPRPAPTSCWAG